MRKQRSHDNPGFRKLHPGYLAIPKGKKVLLFVRRSLFLHCLVQFLSGIGSELEVFSDDLVLGLDYRNRHRTFRVQNL